MSIVEGRFPEYVIFLFLYGKFCWSSTINELHLFCRYVQGFLGTQVRFDTYVFVFF